MGLLDQILGGAGGAMGRAPAQQGGGVGRVLMSLLPVVLGMLANRQRGGAAQMPGSGGLGGMFGGGAGDGLSGLGGLLDQFRQRGLSSQADSWVGTGANQPLAPEQLDGVLGSQQISRIAEQAGLSDIETRNGLAELIPDVVDKLTPEGRLPPEDQLDSGIEDLMRRLRG